MSSYKYDPKSLKAEEFINHEEILESLDYAKKNKDNLSLIREILEKAKKAKGISHKEAAVLKECDDPEINREIRACHGDQGEVLRASYRYVCTAVSLQLLCEWMHLLSISSQE